MNKDDILTNEHELAILIRDAMSEFRRRRLGPASNSSDQEEIDHHSLEYAAAKYGPLDASASDRTKELRTKHIADKAIQVVARCEAAKRLHELSDELASLMSYCHQKVLSIKAAIPAESALSPGCKFIQSLSDAGHAMFKTQMQASRIWVAILKIPN